MSAKALTDKELLQKMSSGDQRAFRSLFDRYYSPLSIYADKILHDTDAAIDIVQGFFVWIWQVRDELQIVSPKSFFYQSVHNRCLNHLKHKKIEQNHAQRILATQSELHYETEEAIEMAELEAQLTAAVDRLPKKCREIFLLSRRDGCTNDEIAQRLDISKRTVETHIYNALQTLRKALGMLGLLIFALWKC